MSLNRNEINPLSVLKLRKLCFIPDHFTRISANLFVHIDMIDHWINFNLNSRYALKTTMTLDQNNNMIELLEIGIEDPREIIMLSLGCPYLHTIKKEIF